MNWTSLLIVFLIVLVWLLARYFYKHSGWLHTNEPIKIPIYQFPRITDFIEKLINKNNFYISFILTPIFLIIILGGLYILMILGKGAIKEFVYFLYTQSLWVRFLIFICFIIWYYGIRIWIDDKKRQSFLTSKKDYTIRGFGSKNIPKEVKNIEHFRIPTYPRFTIYDLSIEEKEKQLFFDSSDILVISEAFGLLDGFNYNTILSEQYLKFKGEKYLVTNVRVDILEIFDDYSLNPFGSKHTKVYEGRDVPYNIQIIVETIRKHV